MDHPSAAIFDAIQAAAQTAARSAADLPDPERDKLGAINWAELGVTEIAFCRNRDGETWFAVDIGEASPGSLLGLYVSDALRTAFPDYVFQVRTEW